MQAPKVIIGLEIHVQLTNVLKTKLFCGCNADYRGQEPNTFLCPVCLGLPGSLPVVNWNAIKYGIMASLALNARVSKDTLFFRKNYYYPDMPKNFQISQYDKAGGIAISSGGYVDIEIKNKKKRIKITRIQIEEDPGRLVHPSGSIQTSKYTLVDYNRSGICLLEVVTEPDMESPEEARLFLQKLRSIMEHLGVDLSLQGSMRCDANISLEGGNRVEVKNISSFKEAQRALVFEISRQKQMFRIQKEVIQETRHWDENSRITISLRTKEEEQDYRYFPEPDLPPIFISEDMLSKIEKQMPELPDARKKRFVKDFNLSEYDASVLVSSKYLADFFEDCAKDYNNPKAIANWLNNDILKELNKENIEIYESKIIPSYLSEMLEMIDSGDISTKIAKKLVPKMVKEGKAPSEIAKEKNLITISEGLDEIIDTLFLEYPEAVQDALQNEKAIRFFVGKVMKKTKSRANPELTNKILKEKLDKQKKSI
ncbi:MAG: Asp-tRNA(Asn)/Glu-tRNA(Gln) amidotransferase subunit GatB [Candidatus Lokiarchaeota archaeon]|nr:Asp-tRNA(Asn)/Glu-tRNA(Gln) amidotransferase subunit GatB [Candidatus Lokiarchaeota archaeon]